MGYTFDERENTFSVLKVLFFSAQVLFLSVKILFLSVDLLFLSVDLHSEVMCRQKVDTPWSIYRDFTV